jgi:hypothetical protein
MTRHQKPEPPWSTCEHCGCHEGHHKEGCPERPDGEPCPAGHCNR